MTDLRDAAPLTYVSQFQETLTTVPRDISEILSAYSNIPKEEQAAHILRLRDKAFTRFPYPCIGNLRFLYLQLASHRSYQDHVLSPLKEPSLNGEPEPLFLDLGSCFGQDVRKLAFDGALVHRLWASDIEPELIDLGFQMFNDADKLPRSHFLCPGNLLADSPDDRLKALDDKVTILHMTAVFHLFTLEEQKRVAHRCLQLLRKSFVKPVLILGGQAGSITARDAQRQNVTQEYSHKYRHNERSWQELWSDVCGKPEWKDKIKSLKVESKLFRRIVVDEAKGSIIFKELDDDHNDGQMLWHMFEVWITFT
ncbi:hypothetical protein F5X99DRAFT_371300 [Biscogniauxia marginata]|nr:hypothetical protein F5X99DRAFT_371300 [Biscogniauxia marginata]